MRSAGLAAFARRSQAKSGAYSYETRHRAAFDAALNSQFEANAKAWAFFAAQPPGYRRLLTYWVMSAKHEATRQRRLRQLIAASARGVRVR
jgi:uncharacterized protein YdeI (YjbR/CyaY-like superfamily)